MQQRSHIKCSNCDRVPGKEGKTRQRWGREGGRGMDITRLMSERS